MKGGHFDKSCELRWAQGKFLANQGLPELLKHFSEASESRVIPDRVRRGSLGPPVKQLCWAQAQRKPWGSAHLSRAAPLLPSSDSLRPLLNSGSCPLAPGRGSEETSWVSCWLWGWGGTGEAFVGWRSCRALRQGGRAA